MTCLRRDVSRLAIPEESLHDPVVNAGRSVTCSAVQADADVSGTTTNYCCQCDRR
jgi:hypothetical protein